MKIGFVFDDTLDKGDGIQQYMFSLQSWLINQGHEVHFLVGQTKRTDIPNIHSLSRNMNVNFNGNRLSIPILGSRKKIKAVLKAEQFDVLHVSVPYHPYMAGWVMKLAPKTSAVVGTFHILPYGGLAMFGAELQYLLSRSSQKRIQSMVSVSPGAQQFAESMYKLNSSVVPNAFNYSLFANAQPLTSLDDNTVTILFLGRLVERKGCMILLQAINRLITNSKDYPSFRVVICGGGPLERQLKHYVNEHKRQSVISFAGRISEADKPKYYAAADISVFPSTSGESFGIVLVEAMANGKTAVIGGDNPGYRSVLGTSPGGLFAANDVTALADKIDELLLHADKRRALADWAASNVGQYDVEVVGPKIVEMYKSVASDSSKGS